MTRVALHILSAITLIALILLSNRGDFGVSLCVAGAYIVGGFTASVDMRLPGPR